MAVSYIKWISRPFQGQDMKSSNPEKEITATFSTIRYNVSLSPFLSQDYPILTIKREEKKTIQRKPISLNCAPKVGMKLFFSLAEFSGSR